MASIVTGIQLNDNFTNVANSIIAATNMMVSTMESLGDTMNTNIDTEAISGIRDYINQASVSAEILGQQIEQAGQQQQNFNSQASAGTGAMDGLLKKAGALVATYASVQSVQKVLNMSDELTQTTARLNLMNDGMQTTPELFNMIADSARATHSPLMATADSIARMGNNAGGAFSSNQELVAFMEQVNKQFVIGGASATEQSNALMQLSQAMAAGALRGDELNSILDAAPGIARAIETNMGWAEGSIKSYAEQGTVTAEVVKNSMLNMADQTNAAFASMPLTFSQAMNDFKTNAEQAFKPVLEQINEIANSRQFQNFVNFAVNGMAAIATAALNVMNIMGNVASFISENWSIIEPIVMGIVTALGLYAAALLIGKGIMLASAAATAIHTAMTSTWTVATFAETVAQQGLNAALASCPITWIIMLIIALIAIIYAVCAAIAKMTGVANSGFGVITGGVNVVIQFFKNLGLTIANIALGIGNALAAVASNMMTAFHNAICSVQSWFYNLLSTALTVIAGICEALNKLPFVEFDYSGITNAADNYAAKAAEAAGNKEDYTSVSDAFNDGFTTFDTFQDGWISNAFNAGAAWGDGVADKVSNAVSGFKTKNTDIGIGKNKNYANNYANQQVAANNNAAQTAKNTGDTAKNTASAAKSLSTNSEDLKYIRDMAEQKYINRFTTAEIKVSMTNHNNVSSDMDLDGIADHLKTKLEEEMEATAKGVYE